MHKVVTIRVPAHRDDSFSPSKEEVAIATQTINDIMDGFGVAYVASVACDRDAQLVLDVIYHQHADALQSLSTRRA
jgi:hypothetical protein